MFSICRISARSVFLFLVCAVMSSSSADESTLFVPQPEHKLLQRFSGEWRFTKKSAPQSGEPEVVGAGEFSGEMLGGFFVIGRWKGSLYGTDYKALQTLGYSQAKKKYIGTWADSIMSHLWQFEGSATEKTLVFVAKGPGPAGETATFRETYQFASADAITVVAEMLGDGGEWVRFMTTELKRKSDPRP